MTKIQGLNGEKTAYARKFSQSCLWETHEIFKAEVRENEWINILYAADKNPTLKQLVEQCMMIYNLSKEHK